ncbi:MAG: hypothetical protein JWM88_3171 [Verrucomicrobia bacterium]|nr:hypothetical protein [Verrucomicrobiota bacterium]
MEPQLPRREFLKTAAVGMAAVMLGEQAKAASNVLPPSTPKGPATAVGLMTPKLDKVRFGFIGLGARGRPTLEETLRIEGCEVRAVCDSDDTALAWGAKYPGIVGKASPASYGGSPDAFLKMLEREDVDAVMICTPWREHVRMAVAAMRAGKHAFVEVPAAVTLEECWQLVETAEQTQRHCMMLENCCYGRDELMVLNLCRQGILGELLHAEGAYLHDLREQMKDIDHGTGSWRTHEHEVRNGNLYPTHGLGPVAQCLGINRGDRFERIVSLSSPSRGMAAYADANFPPDHPRRKATYRCGDMNTSIIQTARGRTIVVQHDTMNPRPYSRTNVVQGTKGIFSGYPNRIYVEGRSAQEHRWDTDLEKWYAEFDHPLWKKIAAPALRSDRNGGMGHGGMDYVMKWRLVQCLREGLPLDQDVYDAAAWSAIGPLSEQSVAQGGAPVEIPDFTRGAWKTTAPLGIVS